MKNVKFTVEAEIPDNVKIHRLQFAVIQAVEKHVVPDYAKIPPRVVTRVVSDLPEKGGAV